MKTAIVIGATGLIGNHLTKLLLDDERYQTVKVFVRRSLGLNNPKLDEQIVDFDKLNDWKNKLTGDELFSCLGTTIKKAGSKDAQYKIDFTYQFETAKAAAENGVKNYLLVSSTGANSGSGNFYLRIKGELEEKISLLPFDKLRIFQPSILVGEREEKRAGESVGIVLGKVLAYLPYLKKYKPIEGKAVAQAMIKSANSHSINKIEKYNLDEVANILK
ncbi:MAG: NAD-dependent epimerase/dehydratase family protein [Ignavibacteriales bacterium]|nr:MAG: NAD-dependent epimerase/dehydratase family protein [Ignavibacteriales bacterium]